MRSNIRTRAYFSPANLFVLLCLLGIFAGIRPLWAAEPDFTIYRTENRSAEELISLSSGLLNTGVRMRAMASKIIIYGSKSQTDAALRLLAELDHPGRQYRIFLRAKDAVAESLEGSAVEGNGSLGKVQVQKRSGVLQAGPRGSLSVGGATVAVQSRESSGASSQGNMLVVSEGQVAALSLSDGWLPSGMMVKVRAMGKAGAHLEIFQQNAQGVQTKSLSTSLDLPLGEWRSLGGIESSGSNRNGEFLGSANSASRGQREIKVKVEAMEGPSP
jgi:hypothetical protein